MSQSPKQGYVIEQFKWMQLFDAEQAEAIKKSTTPVMRISLRRDQEIAYLDMNGQSGTITNRVPRSIEIVIFGGNIMYNQHEVKVEFKAT